MIDGRCIRFCFVLCTIILILLSLYAQRNPDRNIRRKLPKLSQQLGSTSRSGDGDVTQTQEINYQRQHTPSTIPPRVKCGNKSKTEKKCKKGKKSHGHDYRDNIFYHRSKHVSTPSRKPNEILRIIRPIQSPVLAHTEPTYEPALMPSRHEYDDDDNDDYDIYYSPSNSRKSNKKDDLKESYYTTRSPKATPILFHPIAQPSEYSTTRLPTLAPVRLPTRSRNIVPPPTRTEIKIEFDEADLGPIDDDDDRMKNDDQNEDDDGNDVTISDEQSETDESEILLENDEGKSTIDDKINDDGTDKYPNINEGEKKSWQYVLIAGVPFCSILLLGGYLYQCWSKSKANFSLNDKDVPSKVVPIDSTAPLDNTGTYSRMMNSSHSRFNDSEEFQLMKDLVSPPKDSVKSITHIQINSNEESLPLSPKSNSLEENEKGIHDECHKKKYQDDDGFVGRYNQHRIMLRIPSSIKLNQSKGKTENDLHRKVEYHDKVEFKGRYNEFGIDLLDRESDYEMEEEYIL